MRRRYQVAVLSLFGLATEAGPCLQFTLRKLSSCDEVMKAVSQVLALRRKSQIMTGKEKKPKHNSWNMRIPSAFSQQVVTNSRCMPCGFVMALKKKVSEKKNLKEVALSAALETFCHRARLCFCDLRS